LVSTPQANEKGLEQKATHLPTHGYTHIGP